MNHDGYKASLIAPNPLQHEAVIRAACRDARIDPAMVRASSSRGASKTTQREPRVLHHWLSRCDQRGTDGVCLTRLPACLPACLI